MYMWGQCMICASENSSRWSTFDKFVTAGLDYRLYEIVLLENSCNLRAECLKAG